MSTPKKGSMYQFTGTLTYTRFLDKDGVDLGPTNLEPISVQARAHDLERLMQTHMGRPKDLKPMDPLNTDGENTKRFTFTTLVKQNEWSEKYGKTLEKRRRARATFVVHIPADAIRDAPKRAYTKTAAADTAPKRRYNTALKPRESTYA